MQPFIECQAMFCCGWLRYVERYKLYSSPILNFQKTTAENFTQHSRSD